MQPDWLDTNKIAIPQADEQQRLLLNLITLMERDRLPLPRFWYLPRGEKAAVVMSGDDHSPSSAPGGTASHFDRFKALSPAAASSPTGNACARPPTSIPNSALTNAQAAAYLADGFEIALHPLVASCPTTVLTAGRALGASSTRSWARSRAKYTSLPGAGLEPHPLRLLARLGLEREGRARARHPHGRQLLPLPRPPGSAPSPAS